MRKDDVDDDYDDDNEVCEFSTRIKKTINIIIIYIYR